MPVLTAETEAMVNQVGTNSGLSRGTGKYELPAVDVAYPPVEHKCPENGIGILPQ